MVKKPTSSRPPKVASVSGYALNREKILDDIRKNRSYRGGSGTDRKSLFDIKLPCKIWVLPDLKPRGPGVDPLPYLDLSVHWLDRLNREGKPFRSGVTCFKELQVNEPTVHERLLSEKLIQGESCPACEILSAFDASEFPIDKFGKPKISLQRRWHFQVLKEEDLSRGDDHPIKILSAGSTGRDNFMMLVSDLDVPGARTFESEGMFTSWQTSSDGKAWRVTPLNPKKIWLKDWQQKMLDLELITPVFLPREQMIEDLARNLPQFPITKFFNVPPKPPKPMLNSTSDVAVRKATERAAKKAGKQKGGETSA